MDKDILLFVHNKLSYPWLDWFFYTLSTTTTFAFPLIAVICLFLGIRYRRDGIATAIGLVVTIALADSIGHMLKAYFLQPRPCLELGDVLHSVMNTGVRCDTSHDGMPSNHALNFFAAFTFLAAFYKNALWGTIGIVLAALVGVSRIYLGVHYPSQVLAGAAIGTTLGVLTAYALHWHLHKNRSIYTM